MPSLAVMRTVPRSSFWQRWQRRPAFQAAYADRQSGVPELDNRAS
jgi:hypothetical protein